MRTALAATALLLLASCSSDGLTAADAAPFQACSQDQDCVPDSLTCKTTCLADVAVNRDQVQAFEQARGCWPPNQGGLLCAVGSCQAARCAAGQCVLAASPFCGPQPPGGSSGFVTSSAGGTSGAVGFDATVATGTSGGMSSSSSSSGSGSVGGSSASGSSGGASASSGSGSGSGSSGSSSGSTGGSGTSGSGSLGSSGATT